jgi:GNAT superfamily N-acetyltransferase
MNWLSYWLRRVKDWLVEREIQKAEQDQDVQQLQNLVRKHPGLGERFFERATGILSEEDCQTARLYFMALAGSEVWIERLNNLFDQAMDQSPPILLMNLDADNAVDLASYIKKFRSEKYAAFLDSVSDDEFEAINEDLEHLSDFWLELATKRNRFRESAWVHIRNRTRESISQQPLPNSSELWQKHLMDVQNSCLELLSDGHPAFIAFKEIRQVNYLSRLLNQQVADGLVQRIAATYQFWPVEARISALQIIERHPKLDWLDVLKSEWLRIDNQVRQDTQGGFDSVHESSIEPDVELEAYHLVLAMAACASLDLSYTNLDHDEELVKALDAERKNCELLVARYNDLVGQLSGLTRQPGWASSAPPKDENVVMQAQQLAEEIDRARNKYENNYWAARGKFSVGSIFRMILANHQQYATGIRQAIAAGIHVLCRDSHLDRECKNELWDLVSRAVTADANSGVDFRERRVLILKGSCRHEVQFSIYDGLQWIWQVVERAQLSWDDIRLAENFVISFETLETTIELLFERLPQVVSFLEQYPLRLMSPRDASTILANYRESGSNLSLWTRYIPPVYTGKVTHRYVSLNDRSKPNAMGINYRLFSHPLMAVPTLFHEYLHYAGPDHIPGQGIRNETEVWMRECIFFRDLFQQLAPENDELIPQFELEVYRAFRRANPGSNLEHSLRLIAANFDDNENFDLFNHMIYAMYRGDLNDEQAESKADEEIQKQNTVIELSNRTLIWDRHVQWPLLGTGQTHRLATQFRSLLINRYKQRHTLTYAERDRILAEDEIWHAHDRWKAYLKRGQAMQRLKAIWSLATDRASAEDCQAIAKLILESAENLTGLDTFMQNSQATLTTWLTQRIEGDEELLLTMKFEEEIVACSLWTGSELEFVFVASEWQRMGIGSHLVSALLQWSSALWLRKAMNDVAESPKPRSMLNLSHSFDAISVTSAEDFFRQLSFERVGEEHHSIWGKVFRMRKSTHIDLNPQLQSLMFSKDRADGLSDA